MSSRVYENGGRGRGIFRRGGFSGRGRSVDDYSNRRDDYSNRGRPEDDYSDRRRPEDEFSSRGRSRNTYSSRGRPRDDRSNGWGQNDRDYGNQNDGNDWEDKSDHYNGDRYSGRRNDRGFNGDDEGREFRRSHDENRRDGDEKPKEQYIPEDPSDNREDVFGSGISSGLNFSNYNKIDVKVSGSGVLNPIQNFEECKFRKIVYDNLIASGYKSPTPIQKYAFPFIMKKRDLMACAQTGSGKTAAFLVPIINNLLEENLEVDNGSCVPFAIIVSPVRELTQQIFQEARKFAFGSHLKIGRAFGGTVAFDQAQKLRGCHIVVATPGRLNDFVSRGQVSFSSLRYLVLDEADRMLDMGFLPSIKSMLDHHTMPPNEERVTLMFSATFPEEIQKLAADYMNNYLFIAVGIIGSACSDVEQIVIQVPKYQKQEKLKEILYGNPKDKGKYLTLVFVETKRSADYIATLLSESDFPTTSIHGDRLQSQRDAALRDFKSGRKPILVATALAARGLDIKNVMHVINYDMPKSIDEYVHRIGRTGRVGNRGKATSFFDLNLDSNLAGDLMKILQQSGNDVPPFILETSQTRNYSEDMFEGQSFGGEDARKVENWDDYGFENIKSNQGAQEDEVVW